MRVLLAFGLVAVVAAGTASASASPAARLNAAIAAGDKESAVHYVYKADFGKIDLSMVGDAGTTSGVQQITYRKNGTTGHVTVVVVANTAYFRGDDFTLVNYMGMPKTLAAKAAGNWVVLRHGDSAYSAVSAGVRLGSVMSELRLKAPVTAVGSSRVAGQDAVGVRSSSRVSGATTTDTVYVRSSGAPLPVAEVATNGSRRSTLTFSRWNEKVEVSVPSLQAGSTTTTTGNVA